MASWLYSSLVRPVTNRTSPATPSPSKSSSPASPLPRRCGRFQLESQALGRLKHPGIAQIYEASAAETGFRPQPYFTMELGLCLGSHFILTTVAFSTMRNPVIP